MDAIVNVTEDWGIGFEGRLQVTIHADMRRFRELTAGKTVILGRKTLATFPGGKPLKDRRNLILTTRPEPVEGAETAGSLPELFALLREGEEVMVIGGESVYRQLLPWCERAYVTRTRMRPRADAWFPDLDADEDWECEETGPVLEEDGISFRFCTYRNRNPRPIGATIREY